MMQTLDRLALHSITTKPWDLETAVHKYREAGVRGISIWREAYERIGAVQAGKLARAEGLSIVSLVRGGFFVYPERDERQRRIQTNLEIVREAADLGAPHIVLVCGAHRGVRIEEARQQVARGIEQILPLAEQEGIRLAIEPLHPMYAGDRSVINTLSEAIDLCDSLGSRSLGVAIDVYHVWWDPALLEQIARASAASRLFALHVCDWKTPLEDLLEDRGLMGEGCADIPHIRAAVDGAGFKGMIEIEIFSRRYWAIDQDAWLAKIIEAYRKFV